MKQNPLYPVFLKMDCFTTLVVGGGAVALEKLTFLLKSSPNAKVVVVATRIQSDLLELIERHQIQTMIRPYKRNDLIGKKLVIAATNNSEVNKQIHIDAKNYNILVNVADTPDLCDFYLGGIVTKGNLKIAISTNGKSPTTAKRLRQLFEDVLPEELDHLIGNLNEYRKKIKGDFQKKVTTLNTLTEALITKN